MPDQQVLLGQFRFAGPPHLRRFVVNIGELVRQGSVRHGGRLAVTDDAGVSRTYLQLHQESDRIAKMLIGTYGIRRDDRVAVLLPNRTEVVDYMIGCSKSAGIYVGLNFRLDLDELRRVFQNAEPRVLVVGASHQEIAEVLAAEFDLAVVNIDDPEGESPGADEAVPEPLPQVSADDDFCIVYSSGTTGLPKGIVFPHRPVLIHAAVACMEFELDASSVYAVAIPHNSSINITLVPCLMVGARIHMLESRGFDPRRWYRSVSELSASHSYLVPTQVYRVLNEPPEDGELESIKMLGYGAAPTAKDKVEELADLMGPRVCQLYGMAEIASIATMLRKDEHQRAEHGGKSPTASVGQPSFLVDLKVVDDAGNEVANGDRGEVIFTSPYVMREYFRDPERTAQAIRDGWVYSGDIGLLDEAGFLHIVDRKKDLIIRGGHNVASSEIEAVLYRHPAILEVAVFGIPDEQWGESIIGCVTLREVGQATGPEILEWFIAESNMGTIKTPSAIHIIDEMPKNAIGKIAKNELRQQFS
ncbi:MAG: class I adenylate-forming enzyme family protein [Candidatus Nanopelagicales bacterium]